MCNCQQCILLPLCCSCTCCRLVSLVSSFKHAATPAGDFSFPFQSCLRELDTQSPLQFLESECSNPLEVFQSFRGWVFGCSVLSWLVLCEGSLREADSAFCSDGADFHDHSDISPGPRPVRQKTVLLLRRTVPWRQWIMTWGACYTVSGHA